MSHYDDERLDYIEKCHYCDTSENLTNSCVHCWICDDCASELERIDRELMQTAENRIRELQKKREH